MSASQHENALERAAHPEHHPAFDQFVATISRFAHLTAAHGTASRRIRPLPTT